jgi:hypothetical protein
MIKITTFKDGENIFNTTENIDYYDMIKIVLTSEGGMINYITKTEFEYEIKNFKYVYLVENLN